MPASRRLSLLSWRRACCPVPSLLELNSVCDVVMFVSGLGQSQAASAACQPIRAVRGQVSLNSTSPRPAISYRRFCTVYTKKQVYAFYRLVFISCIQCNRMFTFNLVPTSADAKKTERLSVVLLRPFGPARHGTVTIKPWCSRHIIHLCLDLHFNKTIILGAVGLKLC